MLCCALSLPAPLWKRLCTVLFCFVLFHPLISLHFILCHVISYHVISYHYLHSVCPRTVPRTHLTLESIPCVWMPIRRGKGREGKGRAGRWEKGKKRERETDKRKGSGGERREQHIDWMDLCQPPQIILSSPFPSLPFPFTHSVPFSEYFISIILFATIFHILSCSSVPTTRQCKSNQC